MQQEIEIIDSKDIYTDDDRQIVEAMREPQGWVFAVTNRLNERAQEIIDGRIDWVQIARRAGSAGSVLEDYVKIPNSDDQTGMSTPRSLFHAGLAHWFESSPEQSLVDLKHKVSLAEETWSLHRKGGF